MSTNQNLHNEYILMTGAPGSKWSRVASEIRYCLEIDRSDESVEREYITSPSWEVSPEHYYNAPLYHIGAYWDPGMEFGIEREEWDKPFSGTGVRIIKSHTFAHELQNLASYDYPIVLVYSNDVECLEHWKRAGEFNITYPNYNPYYKDLINMWEQIKLQNRDILDFLNNNNTRISKIKNNLELCNILGITFNGVTSEHQYYEKDVQVYVYK